MDAASYGERWAPIYDEVHAERDPADAVALLADLAGSGPALELGIGSGRVAIPLAARGVTVHGVDSSPAMVECMRAKPGGDAIEVTIGDLAELPVTEAYPLIYVPFNTLFALTSQEAQARCFQRVGEQLAPGGRFVVETFVPDLGRYSRGQNLSVREVADDAATIEASQHDPVAQRIRTQHTRLTATGVQLYPIELRYAWPSELDLMARLAGLALETRFGGWRREPFTAASTSAVSVYRRP